MKRAPGRREPGARPTESVQIMDEMFTNLFAPHGLFWVLDLQISIGIYLMAYAAYCLMRRRS